MERALKERKAQVVLEEGQLDLVMENKKKPEQVAGEIISWLPSILLLYCVCDSARSDVLTDVLCV
jgi:hypothetical protein